MYTLGVPNRQYRRATQVLGPESADPIDYDVVKQDDGFYLFSFPDVDEYDFRDIVMLLKSNGVTTIGADDILTERKIMKLTDLLKEQGSPDENNIIDQLEIALERWLEDKTPPYDRLDSCERSDQYHEDIKDIVDGFKNPLPSPGEEDKIEKDDEELANFKGDLDTMQEQKLRKLIRKKLKEADTPLKAANFGLSSGPGPRTPLDPNLYYKGMGNQGQLSEPNVINKKDHSKQEVKIDILGNEKLVTITKKGVDLSDVTISWDEPWGRENHNVEFELDEKFDRSQAYDEPNEAIFKGVSDIWEFYVEVELDANYDDSGIIWDIFWEKDQFHNGLEISKKDDGKLANVQGNFPTMQEQKLKKLKNNMKLKLKDLLPLQEQNNKKLANFQGDLGTMQEQKLRRLIKRKIETMKLKDLLPLKEQNIDSKNPGADPFQKLYDKQNPNDPKAIPGKHFPNTIKKVINLKMDSEVGEPVTVEFSPGSNLTDVKISWGNESYTVDFEKGDSEDNYEHDMIAEFMAESDDMKWQFILDVVLPNNYEDSGNIDDILWDDLTVQSHPDDESHLDPEDRSDYDDDPRMDPAIRSDFDDPNMEEGKFLKEQLQKRAGIIK